jgi:hypothetical protein
VANAIFLPPPASGHALSPWGFSMAEKRRQHGLRRRLAGWVGFWTTAAARHHRPQVYRWDHLPPAVKRTTRKMPEPGVNLEGVLPGGFQRDGMVGDGKTYRSEFENPANTRDDRMPKRSGSAGQTSPTNIGRLVAVSAGTAGELRGVGMIPISCAQRSSRATITQHG